MEGQAADFSYLTATLIFFVYLVVDGLWTLFLKVVADNRKWLATGVSTGIRVLTVYGVVNYTQNHLYVFPLFVGAALGTFLVVHWKSKKEKKPVVDAKKLVAVLREHGIDTDIEAIAES